MRVFFEFEAQLRLAAGTDSQVTETTEGSNLLDALKLLAAQHGGELADRLLDENQKPRSGILMFINNQPVPPTDIACQQLRADDRILLFPPISGG